MSEKIDIPFLLKKSSPETLEPGKNNSLIAQVGGFCSLYFSSFNHPKDPSFPRHEVQTECCVIPLVAREREGRAHQRPRSSGRLLLFALGNTPELLSS